jgi:GntR family transcriptional regulator
MRAAFEPEASGPGYLYMKLADSLSARIAAGDPPPGAMLPNERKLAAAYGVAVGTARRAMQVLRDRGLVVTLPSRGTYVVGSDPPVVRQPIPRAIERHRR